MIRERVQKQVGRLYKPALGFGAPPRGESLELNLEEGAAFFVYELEDGIYLKKVEAPSLKSLKIKGE